MSSARILLGDCRELLKALPPKSVHAVVTSPPYWNLRDYGTAEWEGGDADCEHRVGGQVPQSKAPKAITSGVRPGSDTRVCKDCGARRVDRQIGLETSPEEYVRNMVKVFRLVRRVLRDDGTLWLNLGDSYAGGRCGSRDPVRWPKQSRNDHMPPNAGKNPKQWLTGGAKTAHVARRARSGARFAKGIKPKDLVGIPWMVAFALRNDGWYLRQDNIYAKTNPMPESVGDRTTRAHEYLFQFAKSPDYFYDALAISEATSGTAHWRGGGVNPKARGMPDAVQLVEVESTARPGGKDYRPYAGKNEESGLSRYEGFNERWRVRQNASWSATVTELVERRNKRSVWTITSQPLTGPHFATFPEALAEPCVLAGSSAKGVCGKCGAPLVRQVDRSRTVDGAAAPDLGAFKSTDKAEPDTAQGIGHWRVATTARTLGWEVSCKHEAEVVPATVLDPFCGSGTVGVVCLKTGRNFIGLELNPKYVAYAEERMRGINLPLFNEVGL